MARFTCIRHPLLSVRRQDGTYIEFVDGAADVDGADAALLRMVDDVVEASSPAGPGLGRTRRQTATRGLRPDVVNWVTPYMGNADGYGSSAERMILALDAAGVKVSLDPSVPIAGETTVKHIRDRGFQNGAVRIVYSPPGPTFARRHPGQVTVGFTMWEDDYVPPSWDRYLTLVDVLCTPSTFCAEILSARLSQLGSQVPVIVVPLGVDAAITYQRHERLPTEPFVFLHSSTNMTEPRKGAIEAVQAFRAAFPDRDDVRLILRAQFGDLYVGQDPRVEKVVGYQTEAEKLALLHRCHALVYPSFGEGFGLIPLEAIAAGLPAIVAENTGMLDYRSLFYGIPCTPESSRMRTGAHTISFGKWQRPSHEALVAAMIAHVDSYPNHVQRAAHAAKAAARWSYARSAERLIEAMEEAKYRAVSQ